MSTPEDATLAALAAGEIDATDLRLLDELSQLYETLDPVPGGLVERVQFGITLDALHAEIAELQRSVDLAGVRSDNATHAQTITFTSASLSIMITVSPTSADLARIDGWVTPGGRVAVELRSERGVTREFADEDGRFVFEDVRRGFVQFVVRPNEDPDTRPVVTPSIEI
jgi:hypothetical protein